MISYIDICMVSSFTLADWSASDVVTRLSSPFSRDRLGTLPYLTAVNVVKILYQFQAMESSNRTINWPINQPVTMSYKINLSSKKKKPKMKMTIGWWNNETWKRREKNQISKINWMVFILSRNNFIFSSNDGLSVVIEWHLELTEWGKKWQTY